MHSLPTLSIAAIIALAAAPALGQSVPDMKGTWIGTSHSVVMGGGGHHTDNRQPPDRPFLVEREFTFTFDGQDGRRFWGTTSSNNARENVVGVLRADGKSFIIVDSDGTMLGELQNPRTFELCYAQNGAGAGKSLVVSCALFSKR